MSIPQTPQSTPNAVAPDTSYVVAALEKLRTRLLDLTLSNRLLSFRHTRKTSLRVVDELPNVLWNRLQDGDELGFLPVPPAPPDFVVEAPAVVDETSLAALPPGPAAAPSSQAPSSTQPSNPGGPSEATPARKPTAREYAEHIGLATSFELPEPPAGDDKPKAAHRDKQIQTMHFPEELEAVVRAVSNAARSAIDETGSNMLFLVFGFLEWYETPDATVPLYAPLLTLPVSLRRGDVDPKTRTFRYFISYSGEDAGFNASLHEKMRRDFGIVVPSLEDDELPEAYFARVRTAIADLERWRVRRQLTLSLLSFGKLLMYQDLDPQRWPSGQDPASHPRVRELLAGADRQPGDVSREHDLDSPELAPTLPPIVIDADSSQHSALVDAMRGRNLVIQGPPGTGKSQTIANLIAASMLAGKSVLFVSEKLAALEVVRRRLDAAGLGAFCLELHSHKTQKQELLGDIGRRLEARGTFHDPRDLDAKLEVLRQSRERLSEYVKLLHEPFGAARQSAFDLVWRCENQRSELAALAQNVDESAFPDPAAWSLADLERCRETVSAYAVHLAANLRDAELASHPWHGVTRPARDSQEETAWRGLISSLADQADALRREAKSMSAFCALDVRDTREALDELAKAAHALPVPTVEQAAAWECIKSDEQRTTLRAFAQKLELYATAGATIAGMLTRVPSDARELQAARHAASALACLAPQASSLGDAERRAQELDGLSARLGWHDTLRARVAATLAIELPATLQGCSVALEAIALAQVAPWTALHLRHPGGDLDATEHVYQSALREAQAIWQAGTALSSQFELSLLPDPATLTRYLGACATAGPLRFLDTGYQAAERCYATLSRDRRDAEPEAMARGFQQLASYATRVAAFTQNAEYASAIGPAFRGMSTPFQELTALRAWHQRVLRSLAAAAPSAGVLAQAIAFAQAETLRNLAGAIPDVTPARSELRLLADSLAAVSSGSSTPLRTDSTVPELGRALIEAASAVRAASTTLVTLGFSPSCTVARLPALMDSSAEYVDLYQRLQSDDPARAILGTAFQGAATQLKTVHAALRLDAAVESCGLPPAWKSWLRGSGAAQRIAWLRDCATRLVPLLRRVDETHAGCVQQLSLDLRAWYPGRPGWLEGAGAGDVADRARRAAEGSEQLATWGALLRARSEMEALGLGFLVDLAEQGAVPTNRLWAWCEYGLTRRLARQAIEAHPVLASFDGAAHDQARERFRRYDDDVIQAFRARAAWLVDQLPVPEGVRTGPIASHSELALLEHECRKQRRHVPIRQLLRRAGHALQALKPCFMMGPRSVAQYLEPGALRFDLLVTDEASQLRPEDAFGSICRASQIAIIGDPLQLPPTAFFDRLGNDDEVDDADLTPVDDSESILDVATAAYSPFRRLRWHYRSRHESLIAFSNNEFYGGDLVVFPAPRPLSEDLGVHFELVPEGVYKAGTNEIEVQRVVDALVKHVQEHPGESVGVATMNFKQRDRIDEELQRRAKDDAPLREALDRALAGHEPLFVKNLENVQGDERDVILVSVTYGKDENGRLFQRFGPLNGAAGPRRLNVLFTRARKRIRVFCSFDPQELAVDASSKDGAGVLKRYLAFAKARSTSRALVSAAPANDFERTLAAALRARGLDVALRVGLPGSAMDVAVVDPDHPESFILAIESDGDGYRSAYSARDRDRLRQSALQSMGWAVHRVWTAEWFRDRERVVEGIARRVESMRGGSGEGQVRLP